MHKISVLITAGALSILPFAVHADDAKATATLKKEGCVKCHSVSAEKGGPSFKSVAAKYKGNAEGEAKVIQQFTAGANHAHVKTKDDAEIKNLAKYILSR